MHPPKIVLTVFAAVALTSCATPDPMFLANAGHIRSTNYPANKIVGTWAHMLVNPVQTDTQEVEHKLYLEILPRGRGTVLETARNLADGSHIALQAPFTWTYEGGNLWHVTLPPISAYRVVESNCRHYTPGKSGASRIPLRYYDGNLYDFGERQVLVPADERNVAALANRMRQATPVLHLHTEQ